MAESAPEQGRASFDNQPDLSDELAPDPPRLITADDIPRADSQPTAPSSIITADDIPKAMPTTPESPTPSSSRLPDDLVEVDRTISGVEALRLRQASRFDEPDINEPNPNIKYGRFDGRPIIGHDTKITGGVYIGGGAREAIVVDDYSHPESTNPNRRESERHDQAEYDQVYTKVLEAVASQTRQEGSPPDEAVLKDIASIVDQTLQYDEEFARDIKEKYKDQKVNLSGFINAGKGVCRHQALLAGYLLERLVGEGKLSGKVSIQRNSIEGYGAHAWVNFASEHGNEYIVDVAQGFVGKLEDAPDDGWIYRGY